MSDHNRAYFTGVICSCGSLSTCICSINRQKAALKSKGRFSSAIHLKCINIKNCNAVSKTLLLIQNVALDKERQRQTKSFCSH